MAPQPKKPLELPPVDQALKATVHSLTLLSFEGISVAQVNRLAKAGIRSLQALFKRGATSKGRREIANQSGIDERAILDWVSRADMLRVRGIGHTYAELLEQAGVDTPVELAHRAPQNLYQRLIQVNREKNLLRRTPSLKQVEDWVHTARNLPRVVEY
jgi:predicted flap endonuclease-1-like 5' DNA nuclease